MSISYKVIHQSDSLLAAVREMSEADAIAVDTEANSKHRYPEQLCLIQIATRNRIFIIDTILLQEVDALESVLGDASIAKVFHTAEYDVRSLKQHLGFQIRGVFDVAIAAQFMGIASFSLENLIKELLGETIAKNARLQKADWGRRPLSTEALVYAADDVRYLLELKDVLETKLAELGRSPWVAEECSRIEELRHEPTDPETAYLSMKGASKLDGRSLAVLKAVFLFRDGQALRLRRPRFHIMPDSTLLHLAENPETDLTKTPGLGKAGLQRFGQGLRRALKSGLDSPPVHRERRERVRREEWEEEEERLKHLKTWRTTIGESLSLDPYLIWPRVSLERLSRDPSTLNIELESEEVRNWQREQFAASLSDSVSAL